MLMDLNRWRNGVPAGVLDFPLFEDEHYVVDVSEFTISLVRSCVWRARDFVGWRRRVKVPELAVESGEA